MKMRSGFVSNSSSCSFCIFGWNLNDRTSTRAELTHARLANLFELAGDLSYKDLNNSSGNHIIGVGDIEEDIPGFYEEDEDWRDYECPLPEESEMEELRVFALRHGLPEPILHRETFYDG